jgi:hypothetical protein
MTAEHSTSTRSGSPVQDRTEPDPQRAQREGRTDQNHIVRPVLRCVTLLGGALGSTGASLGGHQIIAISTLLVTAAIIAADLWIGKRRDDVFKKVVMQPEVNPAVLRALTVHEAVRSGLLSSEDTVRLLRGDAVE